MTIIRRQRRDRFTIVPNHIWDDRTWTVEVDPGDGSQATTEDRQLSFLAKSLMAYLLSRPNGWQVNVAHIQKVVGCGRDKAYALLNELIACRFAERTQARDEATGKLGAFDIVIFDEPLPEIQEPVADRFLVSPLPANQEPVIRNNLDNNTPLVPLEVGDDDLAGETVRHRNSSSPPSMATFGPVKAALLEVLDDSHADAIIEYRRQVGYPLTKSSAQGLARSLDGDPNRSAAEAAEAMMASGRRSMRGVLPQGNNPSKLEGLSRSAPLGRHIAQEPVHTETVTIDAATDPDLVAECEHILGHYGGEAIRGIRTYHRAIVTRALAALAKRDGAGGAQPAEQRAQP